MNKLKPTHAGLILLSLAWLLPGLVGHAPWKGGDGEHFARLLDGAWSPPLYFWVARFIAWITSDWLPLYDGARLASGVFVGFALYFAGRTARALYGPGHGWAATLTLMGCMGLLVRGHELNLYTAQFAGVALALHGMARLPQGLKGATGLALGLTGMLFAAGAAEAILFAFIALCLPLALPEYRAPRAAFALGGGLAAAIALAAAGIALLPPGDVAATLQFARWQGASGDPLYFPALAGWFMWPAWPLALWALWRARWQWRTPGVVVPVLVTLGLSALYARLAQPGEEQGLVLLPAVALLGTAGLTQLRRGAANAMLWFGVTCLSLLGLALWFYWSAHDLGVPARIAERMMRNGVPDVGVLRVWALATGVAITLVWVVLLVRVERTPLRPILVWGAGVTFVWCLLFALFREPLDLRLSYRAPAAELAVRVPAGACVDTDAPLQQTRLLAFHSRRALTHSHGCDWKLLYVRGRGAAGPATPDGWQPVWNGARPGDRNERFYLYGRL